MREREREREIERGERERERVRERDRVSDRDRVIYLRNIYLYTIDIILYRSSLYIERERGKKLNGPFLLRRLVQHAVE